MAYTGQQSSPDGHSHLPDARLPAKVPHLEFYILDEHRLDVEADGWGRDGMMSSAKDDGQQHTRYCGNVGSGLEHCGIVVRGATRGSSSDLACRRFRMVVLPAPSRPMIRMRYSRLPHNRANMIERAPPKSPRECHCIRGGAPRGRSCLAAYPWSLLISAALNWALRQ